MNWRVERDSMGDVRVPKAAYWGASTQRAIANFPVSGTRMPRRFIQALGIVKRNCAFANEDLGILSTGQAEWIAAAAQEVMDGKFDEQFPVDVFQTGSATSTNMNANEVIANRAIEMMGGVIGSKTPVHPNDDVNMSQSSNDVIPTVMHVAAALAITEVLEPALRLLSVELHKKEAAFDGVLKSGRTHLVDATPIRLGQEFGAFAAQVDRAVLNAAAAKEAVLDLALGGTATGTGINCPPGFAGNAIARIAAATHVPFRETRNHFAAQSTIDGAVQASGHLKSIALTLYKIANDIRWMGSGPTAGIGEIKLPALQPGSSIMPGKVNPVLCEMVMMVACDVVGNDAAITMGATTGVFQLNTAFPLVADRLLRSIEILANAARTFAEGCVRGITANADHAAATLAHNAALATALAPEIGYDKAAEIAKEAAATGETIHAVALRISGVPESRLTTLLDPRRMTGA